MLNAYDTRLQQRGHETTDHEEWFCGRDVCLILGIQNMGDALTKKVKKAYKTSLHAICEMHMTLASNNEGKKPRIMKNGFVVEICA